MLGLRFSLLLCFSCQLFGLVAFLEKGTLGLDEKELALGSMKKHRNLSASIPIPGPRKKMKLLRKGLMNTPREVRRRTLIACTKVQRV